MVLTNHFTCTTWKRTLALPKISRKKKNRAFYLWCRQLLTWITGQKIFFTCTTWKRALVLTKISQKQKNDFLDRFTLSEHSFYRLKPRLLNNKDRFAHSQRNSHDIHKTRSSDVTEFPKYNNNQTAILWRHYELWVTKSVIIHYSIHISSDVTQVITVNYCWKNYAMLSLQATWLWVIRIIQGAKIITEIFKTDMMKVLENQCFYNLEGSQY